MVLGNFQGWGTLPILVIVGPGPTVLAMGAVRDIFSFDYPISFLSVSRRGVSLD